MSLVRQNRTTKFVFSARCVRCNDVRPSVRRSVCLSRTGVHYDHTVHFSADLSLRLNSPMFWALGHQSTSTYSRPSLPVPAGRDVGCGCVISQERLKIKVKWLLGANRKSLYDLFIGTTPDDIEWPWMAILTSSASRAISAIAELLVMKRCVIMD